MKSDDLLERARKAFDAMIESMLDLIKSVNQAKGENPTEDADRICAAARKWETLTIEYHKLWAEIVSRHDEAEKKIEANLKAWSSDVEQ